MVAPDNAADSYSIVLHRRSGHSLSGREPRRTVARRSGEASTARRDQHPLAKRPHPRAASNQFAAEATGADPARGGRPPISQVAAGNLATRPVSRGARAGIGLACRGGSLASWALT